MFTKSFLKTEDPKTKTKDDIITVTEGMTQSFEQFDKDTMFALEQVPFGICLINDKNVIKYVNRVMRLFFNCYFNGDIVGKSIAGISSKALKRFLQTKISECNAGKTIYNEKMVFSSPSGEAKIYSFHMQPIMRNGQNNGYLLMCQNISKPVKIDSEDKKIVDARDLYETYFNSQHCILLALSATDNLKVLYVSENTVDNKSLTYLQKSVSRSISFPDMVFKNDSKRYVKEMENVVRYGLNLEFIYFRFIDGSGMVKWVKQTTIPKLSESGSVEYIICTIEDASLKSAILDQTYSSEELLTKEIENITSETLIEKHIDMSVLNKILDEKITHGIIYDYNDVLKIGELSSNSFVISDNGKLIITNDSQIKKAGIDVLRFVKATKNFYEKFVENNFYESAFCDADGKAVRLIAFGVNKTLISIYFTKPIDDVFCNVDLVCKYLKITLKHILKVCMKNISVLNQIDEYKNQQEEFIEAINIQKSIPSLISLFYSCNNYFTGFKNVLSKICDMIKLDRIHVYSYSESNGKITNYMNYFVNNEYMVDAKELSNVLNAGFMELFSATNIIHVSNYVNVSSELKEYASVSRAVSSIMYAIKIDGAIRFFVIFDDMHNNREWQSEVLLLIENICSVLSTLILNEKTMSNMIQTQRTLERVLNEIDQCIYVIEDGTREILYLNKTASKTFEGAFVHKRCDECMCTDICLTECPLAQLAGIDNEEGIFFEYYSDEKETWYAVNANRVKWEGVKRAILITLIDVTESKKSKRKDEEMYLRDFTTGLYNNNKYQQHGNTFLKEAGKNGKKVANIVINIPELKEIAEEYGYKSVADTLVRTTAILNRALTDDEIFIAKIAEDNFIVMLTFDDEKTMFEYVRQIASDFDKMVITEDMQRHIRFAIGVSFYPEHGLDIDTLYQKSWFAVKMAIEQKGINYKLYDKLVQTTIEKEEKFRKDVLNAFKNKQFSLYFQPKLNLKTNKIDSAEALIRWNHPERGILSAGEFVDILEESDKDDKFGLYIMEETIKSVKMINSLPDCQDIRISFNVLGKTFFRYDFFQRVLRLVEIYKVKPSNLEIELTEKMLLKSTKHSLYVIAQFRQYGVKLSIDDFGTGYSSLSYLKNLNVDVLKIDKIFLEGIFKDEKSKNIAINIINLAKMLQYEVLFEGIETEQEMEFVKENGCDYVQGFYVGTALSKEEFVKVLTCRNEQNKTVNSKTGNLVSARVEGLEEVSVPGESEKKQREDSSDVINLDKDLRTEIADDKK